MPDKKGSDDRAYARGFAAGRAAATPDPDATAVLAAVKAIIDEPLDERDGHGPTRTGQFARIDALLRDRPTTAWDEGYAEGFAAGRAAATPPDTDLLAELVKLVEIHHNTVRPSKLHDPVSIHDWRDCPCLTCRRVASVEAVVKAEGRTPVVGRYMRWLRNEWGATPSTCRDYEAILARMALMLGDREAIDVGIALECVFRDALSAAWRVVTGSNAAVSGGDEGNTP